MWNINYQYPYFFSCVHGFLCVVVITVEIYTFTMEWDYIKSNNKNKREDQLQPVAKTNERLDTHTRTSEPPIYTHNWVYN